MKKEKRTKNSTPKLKENRKQNVKTKSEIDNKVKKKNIDKKKIGIYLLILAVFIYVCYTIYLLVKQPTDIFTVEEGKLYQEETNIRICNKKRKSSKRAKL